MNDKGTLYQLKELIHRTSVGNDPKHRTKSSEDFLLTVLHAHIIAAAKVCCREQNIEDCLACAKEVVKKFVNVQLSSQIPVANSNDMSYNYATNLLTLGLVWHGYHDAIKEGDGNRILLYWKFLIPIFHQERHYNYAKEGFHLLVQSSILSERKIMELKWSRTVNMHGRQGCNIPIDLFMEHMNRLLEVPAIKCNTIHNSTCCEITGCGQTSLPCFSKRNRSVRKQRVCFISII